MVPSSILNQFFIGNTFMYKGQIIHWRGLLKCFYNSSITPPYLLLFVTLPSKSMVTVTCRDIFCWQLIVSWIPNPIVLQVLDLERHNPQKSSLDFWELKCVLQLLLIDSVSPSSYNIQIPNLSPIKIPSTNTINVILVRNCRNDSSSSSIGYPVPSTRTR